MQSSAPISRIISKIVHITGISFKQRHPQVIINPVFCHKSGKALIGNGLFLLHPHQIIHIGKHGICHLAAINIFLRKLGGKLYPDEITVPSAYT